MSPVERKKHHARRAVNGEAGESPGRCGQSGRRRHRGDVTTDYFGNGYEVIVTRSDGSKVAIHLDRSFDAPGPPGGGIGAPPAAVSN
jgi:hypothetical protein